MSGTKGGRQPTLRTRLRVGASIASFVTVGFWLVQVLYFGADFGWPITVALLALAACQCLALLPHIIRPVAGRFWASSLLVRALGVTSCVLASAFVVMGTLSWILHHGLVGFVEPTSMSGFTDEAGVFYSATPSMTILDLCLSALFVTGQLWGGLIVIRGSVSATPNTYQPSPRQVRRSSPSGRARKSKRHR